MKNLVLLTILLVSAVFAQHPQLLLDSATLAAMRAKVAANSVDWVATKAICDTYLTSNVYWPSYLGDVGNGGLYPGNTGTLDNGCTLGIGNGCQYEGGQYYESTRTLGVCYQSLSETDITAARAYSAKAREIVGALTSAPITVQKGTGPQYYIATRTKSGAAYGLFYWEKGGTGINVGDTVTIAGATGCTNLNGTWTVSTSAPSTIAFTDLPAANSDCTNHNWEYTRDNNFGARFYGRALAMLYDWINPELTTSESAALTSTMVNFSDAIYRNGYGGPASHPETNYTSSWSNFFIGCYAAWLNENPTLSNFCNAQWNATVFGANGVRDYYNRWMHGGGYGEGVAAYGYGGMTALTEATMAASRLGVDWRSPPYSWNYIEDQAKYLLMASKPDRNSMDEQEYVYFDITPNPDNPTLYYPSLLYPLAWALQRQGSSYAPYFQSLIQHFESTSGVTPSPLDRFMYYNADASTADPTTLPKSYLSFGGNFATARSDWSPSGVVLHFQGGPSTGGAGNGKTQFESGAFSIWNGSQPFVVFGGGERSRSYDILSSTDAGNLHNERALYGNHKASIFAADRPGTRFTRIDGLTAAITTPGQIPSLVSHPTKIDRAEDAGVYAYYRSVSLQSVGSMSQNDGQYHRAAWTRQIMFIRPKTVVIYDTTATKYVDDDRAMFWTFGRDLAQTSDPAEGQHRFYSTHDSGATFKGALTTVLPSSSAVSIVNHGVMTISGSGPTARAVFGTPLNFLYRVEQRPPSTGHSNDTWLSVADAATSPGTVESITALAATNADLVQLSASGVVGFASVSLPITYAFAGAPNHIVAGLTPSAGYHVAFSAGPFATITAGTGIDDIMTTTAGVLAYSSPEAPPRIPPAITTQAYLPTGLANAAYSHVLAASGDLPIAWAIVSGSLPPGLSLNSTTGVISGSASASGTYVFTIQASNIGGSDSQALVMTFDSHAPFSSILGKGQIGGKAVIR